MAPIPKPSRFARQMGQYERRRVRELPEAMTRSIIWRGSARSATITSTRIGLEYAAPESASRSSAST